MKLFRHTKPVQQPTPWPSPDSIDVMAEVGESLARYDQLGHFSGTARNLLDAGLKGDRAALVLLAAWTVSRIELQDHGAIPL